MTEPGAPPSAPTDTSPSTTAPADGSVVLPSAGAAVDAVASALQAQFGPGAGTTTSTTLFADPPTTPAPEGPLAVLARPAGGAGRATDGHRADRTRRSRPGRRKTGVAAQFWRYGFPVVMALIMVSIVLLGWAGKKVVLQSTDGRLVTEVTDPAAPGWTAITDPTPTLLLVQTDAAGVPNGLTVMSLTGDGAGGVVFLPMTTVLELADVGRIPLNTAFAKGGMDALQKGVEGVLRLGTAEVSVVSPTQLTDLVAPVSPLQIVNPDDVTAASPDGTKKVVFPKGTITLEAKDVAAFLATSSPDENDLNRLVRHKAFWESWLRKVGTSGSPDAVPGESRSGLGRFVRALATDRVELASLPVQGVAIPGSTALLYLPVKDQVQTLMAKLVPYPIGAPPGARPRVRLLDGTGSLQHGLPAAPTLVAGGGQIDQIGNAPAFGAATTQLVYFDDARHDEVEKLQVALGVGELVKGTAAGSAVDVVITLGQDFAGLPPRTLSTVGDGPTSTTTTDAGAPSG